MKILSILTILLFLASCSTSTTFTVPKGQTLFIEGKEISKSEHAVYKRQPFFWDVAKGIPYRLEKKGKVVSQGRVKAHFRVASIFWPPAAIIYWPMRFEPNYDFTSGKDRKVRPAKK